MADCLLIASDDSKVGFRTRSCTRETLSNAVHLAMFGHAVSDTEMRTETERTVEGLLREGRVDFGDGWIELRTGIDDIVSFFMLKLTDFKDEEVFADKERAEQHQRANLAEQEHKQLCAALVKALGPAGAADVRGKVAYAQAGAST